MVQALFAANAVFGKVALAAISPTTLVAVRVPASAIFFFLLRAAWARRAGWQPVARRDLPALVLLSLIGVAGNQLCFTEGLARTSATNTAVLMATIPVFTSGLAIALGRERPTARRLLGLAIALGGALLIALFGRSGAALRLEVGPGELFLLANSFLYALYLVLSRPLFLRYRTETAMTWIFAIGAVLLLPFDGAIARELGGAPMVALAAVAYVVIGATIAAYFLNAWALTQASSVMVAIYIYLQPVFGALLASVVLHERLSPITAAAGALIGVGIALVSL